jgi:rod shape determining protein RodA
MSVFLGLNAVAIFLSFEKWLIYFNVFVFAIMTIIKMRQKEFRLMALVWPATIFCILLSLISRYAFEEFLEPHQQDRINVWLKPSECNEQGSLYNLLQSKMAIGSGGFQGKGFLEGTMTKLDYVPEQSTDFIFSTIGEEQGFIGSFAIITIFVMFILRIIKLGERNKNNFVRHYAYGLAGLLFIHFFINIGMTMGLVPIVGIPLPFISKGGSALLSFTIMFAVLMRMDSARY